MGDKCPLRRCVLGHTFARGPSKRVTRALRARGVRSAEPAPSAGGVMSQHTFSRFARLAVLALALEACQDTPTGTTSPISESVAGVGPHGGGPPRSIVYSNDCDGDVEIVTLNADGTGLHQVTFNDATDNQPRWSTNGKLIYFGSDRSGNEEVWVMNADGSDQHQLTHTGAAFTRDINVSTNDKELLFDSDLTGDREIFVISTDGGEPKNLTNSPTFDIQPDISTDGKRIVFARAAEDQGITDLYVMNADGSGLANLTNSPEVLENQPAWSSNGQQIVFSSDAGGEPDIWVMHADGSGLRDLTNTPETPEFRPRWSHSGHQIYFLRLVDDQFHLFVMNADGSGQAKVTNLPCGEGGAD